MKLKILIPSLLFFRLLSVFAQTAIIDSVYSDMYLDGYIMYRQYEDFYEINTYYYAMPVGDYGVGAVEPPPYPNSVMRAYISFDLPEIPQGYIVDSVYVRLYQYACSGNDDIGNFPVWDVAGGDTVKCILSHIDYGDELDVEDWEKGDEGNPFTFEHNAGIVTESSEVGYRYIDVTSNVVADYEMQRDKTQYRIAFQIDTDWDDKYDKVDFLAGFSTPEYDPLIVIRFQEESFVEENTTEPVLQNLRISPNPACNYSNLSFCKTTDCRENTEIIIYNLKGQKVLSKNLGFLNTGAHTVPVRTDNLSSGIYFLKIKSDSEEINTKFLIVK